MSKIEEYRQKLRSMPESAWQAYLLKESGLPGPRGNLELAWAAADEGSEKFFNTCLEYDENRAPANNAHEFLAFCGAVGLGRLLAEGKAEYMAVLRHCANDARWRMREAVAQALQRFGKQHIDGLLSEMEIWSRGSLLEKRAAAAALCEPMLLKEARVVQRVLDILETITASIPEMSERKSDEFKALRKGLGYCWSVAAAALPESGKAAMEKWFKSEDKDIRWMMKENLRKNRLIRIDPAWVEKWMEQL